MIKWRKTLIVFAGFAFLVGTVPVLVLSLDGRWNLPSSDYQVTLDSLNTASGIASNPTQSAVQRVVWIGHPDILGTGSWQLGENSSDNPTLRSTQNLAYSVTLGSTPSIAEKWVQTKDEATEFLEAELNSLHETNRLGRRLALFGVSHIILLEKSSLGSSFNIPVNARYIRYFDEQFDLQRLDTREGIYIYENTEVIPIRSALPPGYATSVFSEFASATDRVQPLPEVREIFGDSDTDILEGDFYFADTADNWTLEILGEEVEVMEVLGWAKLYPLDGSQLSGSAKLTYETPSFYRLFQGAQILLWIIFLSLTAWAIRRAE